MRRLLRCLALPGLLLLAGCGDEPDEAAMRTALETRLQAEQAQMRQMMGGMAGALGGGRAAAMAQNAVPAVRVVEFRKGSCSAAQGQPGHICDFSMTVEADGRRNASNLSARFFKAGSGQLDVELRRL